MNPGEFISFANSLSASATSGPAGYRSAVSRAYYGAYLSVLSLVEVDLQISCKIRDKSEHAVLQMFLVGCQVPEAAAIGLMLGNLHQCRKEADYEMDNNTYEDQVESQRCVDRAADIVRELNKCQVMSTKQKIKAGMIQHRRMLTGMTG
jgi:uncharacterized protein (UPF0332 family)